MGNLLSRHTCIRLLSILCTLILGICGILFAESGTQFRAIPMSLLAGGLMLLFVPLSHEDIRISLISEVMALVIMAGIEILSVHTDGGRLIVMASGVVLCVAFICYRQASKYTDSKKIFVVNAQWESVEETARICYAGILTLCSVATTIAEILNFRNWAFILLTAIILALYVILYARAWSGSTMMVSKAFKDEIRELAQRCGMQGLDESSLDKKTYALYKKIVDYMNREKPYLDDKFDEEKMSRQVLSNVYYISRCINSITGMNFRRFVNDYRVRYSLEMIRKDPHLRVIEVAMMSGFCSTSTFNVAFKLTMKMTPTEYIKAVQAEAL